MPRKSTRKPDGGFWARAASELRKSSASAKPPQIVHRSNPRRRHHKTHPLQSTPNHQYGPRFNHHDMKRLFILLFFILTASAIEASAQGVALPWVRPQWLSNAGAPLANGFLCTFKAGTTTLQATFSDLAITSALPNPVHLNSAGRPQTGGGTETEIYLNSSITYKLVLYGPGTGNTCNGTNVGSQVWP